MGPGVGAQVRRLGRLVGGLKPASASGKPAPASGKQGVVAGREGGFPEEACGCHGEAGSAGILRLRLRMTIFGGTTWMSRWTHILMSSAQDDDLWWHDSRNLRRWRWGIYSRRNMRRLA